MSNLPNISILIPTYNRRNFIPFILRNLKIQEYPHNKLQVVINDDGDLPLIENYEEFRDALKPIKLKYMRNEKRQSIGKKRHDLIQNANHNIVVFMDDDDLYEPTYISHSYTVLKENKAGCVGCNKMIFIYPPYTKEDFYALDCGDNKKLIHEATMMMTKKWYKKTLGFTSTSIAEGLGITESCNLKTIALTNPLYNMTAIVHGSNTVDKEKFKDENMKLNSKNISFEEKTSEFIKMVVEHSEKSE